MQKLSSLVLMTAFSLVVLSIEISQASILNGGFESDYVPALDWTTIGQIAREEASFGVAPIEGNFQAILETLQNNIDAPSPNLETFLGLLGGTLTSLGAIEGSGIKQTIIANAGDVLTFSWNFLTDQDPPDVDFNDFAFFNLNNSLIKLADTNSPTIFSVSRLLKETGYQSSSYTIPTAGTYTLGFGIVDVGDDSVNSALLVDKVKVTNVSVPESSYTFSLIVLGLGALLKCNLSKRIMSK